MIALKTKVIVLGIGRMGKEIVRQCHEESFDIVAAIDNKDKLIGEDVGSLAGLQELGTKVKSSEKLESILKEKEPEVAIDFTQAEACVQNSQKIAEAGINMVIGTTGFSDEQFEELTNSIRDNNIGAIISPNMSVGVNVFWELIKEAAGYLQNFDVEIIEKHHRFKNDAPSGTALKTAKIIAEENEEDLDKVGIYGRKGENPRKRDEIGIHAIRGGDITGEHNVIFATLGERIEIQHKAHSKGAFVSGVIEGVKFIKDRQGIYSMKEVLGI